MKPVAVRCAQFAFVLGLLIHTGCDAARDAAQVERAKARGSNPVVAQVERAYAALQEGNAAEFENAIQAAIQKYSKNNADERLAVASALFAALKHVPEPQRRERLIASAVMTLADARQLEPHDPGVASQFGYALYLRRSYAEAITQLEYAVNQVPTDRQTVHILARCHMAQDEPALAIRAIQRASGGRDFSAADNALIGECRYLMHEFQESVTAYKKALEVDSENARTWHNLALVYQELKNTKEMDQARAKEKAIREKEKENREKAAAAAKEQ